jgi:SAM-dependent methyltransferase
MNCLCCGKSGLEEYLDLGIQPLANDYDGVGGTHPLKISFCDNCSHSQLSHFVDPHILFDNYYYVTGVSPTFRKHFADFAEKTLTKYGGNKVLDIGCNDGTLLAAYKKLGCDVHGVDPAENLVKISSEKGIPVTVDYWGADTSVGVFDIITGTNVFAHTQDPQSFLIGCRRALTKNGVVIIEFPYARNMIEGNEFDTIYHEHSSYFTIRSMCTLVESIGMVVYDVESISIHGGSVRIFIKHSGPRGSNVDRFLQKEKSGTLNKVDTYYSFGERIKALQEIDYGHSVGYGAAAKCTVALNYLNMDLDYIVDDNKMKWGKKVPGTNIPIENPERLIDDKPQLITVFAWNLWEDIVDRVKKLRFNTTLRRYIPKNEKLKISE